MRRKEGNRKNGKKEVKEERKSRKKGKKEGSVRKEGRKEGRKVCQNKTKRSNISSHNDMARVKRVIIFFRLIITIHIS